MKRKSNVIGIFPNEASLPRLMGSILIERNEVIQNGRLNNVEISMLLYGGIAALLAVMLMLSYRKSQVESR